MPGEGLEVHDVVVVADSQVHGEPRRAVQVGQMRRRSPEASLARVDDDARSRILQLGQYLPGSSISSPPQSSTSCAVRWAVADERSAYRLISVR